MKKQKFISRLWCFYQGDWKQTLMPHMMGKAGRQKGMGKGISNRRNMIIHLYQEKGATDFLLALLK